MILFYDTETSGLPANNLPDDHPSQPCVVQLAAVLTEDDGKELACMNLTVKPDGWRIPDEAVRSHGITTERATTNGVPLVVALGSFINLRALATELVGHNIDFDQKIIRCALARINKTPVNSGPTKITCTMRLATPIVNLPPTPKMLAAGFDRPKNASLSECYKFFFDEELPGAHDAMVDVRATMRIYFKMRGAT